MFTLAFWKAATERAVKSAAQSAILVIGADQVVNAIAVDWPEVGGFALGGAALSLLTSLISAPFGPTGSPSVVEGPADGDTQRPLTSGH